MNKIIYVLIGIFTFSVGFWIYQLNFENNTTQLSDRIEDKQHFSLCEIAENPTNYQARQVTVRAFIAVGGYYDARSGLTVTDYKSDCASKIPVYLPDELKRNENFLNISEKLFQNLNEPEKRSRDGWAVAEVEFTGAIITTSVASVSGIASRQYFVLEPVEIKEIAPVKFISVNEVSPSNNELILN